MQYHIHTGPRSTQAGLPDLLFAKGPNLVQKRGKC